MTTLYSSMSTAHRACAAEYRRMAYIQNGWNAMRRWNGRTAAAETAGIDGPSQAFGTWTPCPSYTAPAADSVTADAEGARIFRYRYMDSRTGYVSDPSLENNAYNPTTGLAILQGAATFLIGGTGTTFGPHATGLAITTLTITRDSGSWITDGFSVGDYFTVASAEDSGNNGVRGPIGALTATVLTIAATVNGARNQSDFNVANADDTAMTITRHTKGRIQASTDSKVDTIILESTVVGGGDQFFVAGKALNTATTLVINITDAALEQAPLPWPAEGHRPPPISKYVVSYRERLWCFGQVLHEFGNADVTNGSADVDEGTVIPDWNNEALGSSDGDSSVSWLFQRAGDATEYEISYYDLANTKIVLKKVYAGATGNDVSYKIFSRTNAIWISNPGFPEGFTALYNLNGPNGEGSGDMTAGIGFGGSMVFFSLSAMYRFTWDTDPSDGFMVPLNDKAGALNQRVVTSVEGVIYFMDRRGWWRWKGGWPELISRPLGTLSTSIDFDQADNFHVTYLPESRAVRWFVSYTGETYPKHYVQFDIDTGAWSTGSFNHGIAESRLVSQGKGLRTFWADDQGHTWWGDTGLADGVPAAKSHVTVTTGSTTTVIQILGGGLATSNGGYAGCYLTRRLSTGATESRLISSNTATAITVSSAFSGSPAANDVLWIGAIPSLLLSRAFRPQAGADKVRADTLTITFNPVTSVRYLMVKVYENLSDTAKTWGVARNSLPGLVKPGANTLYPTSAWLIDLSHTDGVVSLSLGGEWKRCFEVELSIEEPDADFQLISLDMPGVALQEVGVK